MKPSRWLLYIAACLPMASVARADDADLKRLQGEWETAVKKWSDASKTSAGEAKPPDMTSFPGKDFRPRFRKIAEKNSGDAAALPALMWLIDEGVAGPDDADGRTVAIWAVERLAQDHAGGPDISGQLNALQWAHETVGTPPMAALFKRIIDQNPDREVKAQAMVSLAALDLRPVDDRGDEAGVMIADGRQQAVEILRKVTEEYANTSAAKHAEAFLFEAEHLQVGMTAPDIVGSGAEGDEIKLSQFAGKVVVLDFWGFW